MFTYAQLTADNVVMGVSTLKTEVDAPNMVLIEGEPPQSGSTWDGETFTAPEPQPDDNDVPESVPMWAAQAVMEQAGIWDSVNAAVQASGNSLMIAAFARSPSLRRDSNSLVALKGAVGLSDGQIDELFRNAQAIADQI